ncbi:MAG: phosphoadenosine phosphosulfate reductase family protein, partial [Rubrivivax sp.]
AGRRGGGGGGGGARGGRGGAGPPGGGPPPPAAQSVTRTALPPREHDAAHGLEKFNPLHDWSEAEVWAYLRAHAVPTNELHERFFPSIGCAPCTRAITPGEDLRAGRWWWEQPGGGGGGGPPPPAPPPPPPKPPPHPHTPPPP